MSILVLVFCLTLICILAYYFSIICLQAFDPSMILLIYVYLLADLSSVWSLLYTSHLSTYLFQSLKRFLSPNFFGFSFNYDKTSELF